MKLNSILSWAVLFGIIGTAFIPFIVSTNLFFPFITGKAFTFRILVEIIFGLWAILAIRDQSFIPKKSHILWSFVVFVAVMFVANYFGVNREASFWSNFERMDGFVTIAHLLALFIVMISVFRNKKLWAYFANTWILSGVIMSFYGLLQLSGSLKIHQGNIRLDGTLGNATYLAVFLLFSFFIALYLIYKTRNIYLRWIYATALVLYSVVIFYTATRGALLGLIGGVLLTALLTFILEKEDKKLKKISMGVVLGAVALVGLFIVSKDSEIIQNNIVLERFANISLEDKTTRSRFVIWELSAKGFKERPVLGWGQSNFNYVFDKYYDSRLYNQEQWFDHAHNTVIDWLIAGGLLGLIAYLLIWISIIWYLWKSSLSVVEKSILTGMLAGYFFQNLFVFDNLVSYILFISTISYIHTQSVGTREVVKNKKNKSNKVGVKENTLSFLILFFTIYTVYVVNVPAILASSDLVKAVQLGLRNDTKELLVGSKNLKNHLELFEKVFERDTFADSEARIQLLQNMTNILPASNVSDEDKQAFLDLAISEMQKQILEAPGDIKYLFVLATFYAQIGNFDKSIETYSQAVEIAQNKPTVIAPLIQAYYFSGQKEKAFAMAKDLYEKEKLDDQVFLVYADLSLRDGNREVFNQLIFESISLGAFDRAIILLERVVELNLDNPEIRITLSEAYFRGGQTSKALEVLEEVSVRFPDARDNVQIIINKINDPS